VEDVGEETKLVERRIALAALVAGELGVVDLSPLRFRLVLDAPQREAVTDAQPPEVVAQPCAASQLLFHWQGFPPCDVSGPGPAGRWRPRPISPAARAARPAHPRRGTGVLRVRGIAICCKSAATGGTCQEGSVIAARFGYSAHANPVRAATPIRDREAFGLDISFSRPYVAGVRGPMVSD